MIVGAVVLQLAERFAVGVDFTRRVTAGDSVASAAVTAVKVSDGSPTPDLLAGAPLLAGAVVSHVVQGSGGQNGVDYVVAFQATTTDGAILEDELRIMVRETATA